MSWIELKQVGIFDILICKNSKGRMTRRIEMIKRIIAGIIMCFSMLLLTIISSTSNFIFESDARNTASENEEQRVAEWFDSPINATYNQNEILIDELSDYEEHSVCIGCGISFAYSLVCWYEAYGVLLVSRFISESTRSSDFYSAEVFATLQSPFNTDFEPPCSVKLVYLGTYEDIIAWHGKRLDYDSIIIPTETLRGTSFNIDDLLVVYEFLFEDGRVAIHFDAVIEGFHDWIPIEYIEVLFVGTMREYIEKLKGGF